MTRLDRARNIIKVMKETRESVRMVGSHDLFTPARLNVLESAVEFILENMLIDAEVGR